MKNQTQKIEDVKTHLGAMRVEPTETGYYVRFRKSKSHKIMLDDIFQFEDVMEEDGWKRIGEYEIMLTSEAFEEVYRNYYNKLYDPHW